MKPIKKLDIFVFKNFITLFIGTFFICQFIVMMQFIWKYVDDLVGKGLPMSVLSKFFLYAGETLISLALPLAILLASLISFGNLGERLELLSIKAAGISLYRTLAPIAIFILLLSGVSFYIQDRIAPQAQMNLYQLLFSMRQKSPELDIPEGVFYDGIQDLNLYVRKKDKDTGSLYNVMIYNLRDGADKVHILLADSGRLETTADKGHLLLHLYNGEQFENLNTQALQTKNVPYRRETFVYKQFIIEFDNSFNLADADNFSSAATTKNMDELRADADSLEQFYDSIGRYYYQDMAERVLKMPIVPETELKRAEKELEKGELSEINLDSVFNKMTKEQQSAIIRNASQEVARHQMDVDFKSMSMKQGDEQIRRHWIQIHTMITMALACLVFFFIGAPLGAIIRKGGLGLPVVISVIIFIIYYIINKGSSNLAREGSLPVWLGTWFSTLVLVPVGAFFTIKANNDSVVFNADAYREFFRRLLGIRSHRYIVKKEVIIDDPNYSEMVGRLQTLSDDCEEYLHHNNLKRFPNYIRLFFKIDQDVKIEHISDEMEYVVEVLSNSKDRQLIRDLNRFPVLDLHSHTCPFKDKRLNMASGIIFPVGVFLIFRVARFRIRLLRDLRNIVRTCSLQKERCKALMEGAKTT